MIKVIDYEISSPKALNMIIYGMRNSWESYEKGDSILGADGDSLESVFFLGDKDAELAQRLTIAGKDHGKYLRQITIQLDILAPEYWWKEADQYKIGVSTNSTSMMHVLGKNPFSVDMFSLENVDPTIAENTMIVLNNLRDRWIESGKKKSSNEWRAMLQLVPHSWNYRRAMACNYQVLRDMYFARKNHKLHEWRDFAKWIETLPYSRFLTES